MSDASDSTRYDTPGFDESTYTDVINLKHRGKSMEGSLRLDQESGSCYAFSYSDMLEAFFRISGMIEKDVHIDPFNFAFQYEAMQEECYGKECNFEINGGSLRNLLYYTIMDEWHNDLSEYGLDEFKVCLRSGSPSILFQDGRESSTHYQVLSDLVDELLLLGEQSKVSERELRRCRKYVQKIFGALYYEELTYDFLKFAQGNVSPNLLAIYILDKTCDQYIDIVHLSQHFKALEFRDHGDVNLLKRKITTILSDPDAVPISIHYVPYKLGKLGVYEDFKFMPIEEYQNSSIQHAVLIIGEMSKDNMDYYLIRNSVGHADYLISKNELLAVTGHIHYFEFDAHTESDHWAKSK